MGQLVFLSTSLIDRVMLDAVSRPAAYVRPWSQWTGNLVAFASGGLSTLSIYLLHLVSGLAGCGLGLSKCLRRHRRRSISVLSTATKASFAALAFVVFGATNRAGMNGKRGLWESGRFSWPLSSSRMVVSDIEE
ncbi:hypothetical protein LY76DRAFT_179008 [Colletotrichum caudatum]|nr:hypothetical protein LY76DRAFT_179008 [Colletotrichum caudatum]